jgi:quercetin dioxygenase-like cupin family protein
VTVDLIRPSSDDPLRVLLSGGEGDPLGVVEMILGPGGQGPPLHVHPTHGEGFYVLEGELTVQVGDRIVTGGPGTWAFAPRDTPHTLGNLGEADVRVLSLFAPAGFERRFERFLAEQAGTPLPARTAAEQETRMVGPTLAERRS